LFWSIQEQNRPPINEQYQKSRGLRFMGEIIAILAKTSILTGC
jgi:hypothetical protein